MSILIRSEYTKTYTKIDHSIYIETKNDEEPKYPSDIIGFEGEIFDMVNYNFDGVLKFQNDMYKAFKKQKEDDEKNYDVEIDIKFAKKFLYEECIQDYGIIDNLIDVIVNKNNIYVKYEINNKVREYTFIGYGFELLRKYRLFKMEE